MAILNIKGSDYWFIISLIRNETVNVVQNVDLTKKAEHKTNNLFSYIKMVKKILTSSNIEIKKKNFTTIRPLFFLGDVNIENVSVYKKISFGEKNYKYFY